VGVLGEKTDLTHPSSLYLLLRTLEALGSTT
jgi:hypothetical protein